MIPVMHYSDDSRPGRFLAGDPEVHAEVGRWVARVLTLPRFRLIRRQWVDLHQDVLGRVVESLRRGRFDVARDFRVYCQSIARYAARDAVVRQLRESRNLSLDEVQLAETRDEFVTAMAGPDAKQLLDLISEDCRSLFREYYLEERGYEEIARTRGIPVGTVKSRLFRCLSKARAATREGTRKHKTPK